MDILSAVERLNTNARIHGTSGPIHEVAPQFMPPWRQFIYKGLRNILSPLLLFFFQELLHVLARTDAPVTALATSPARTAAIATSDDPFLFVTFLFDDGTDHDAGDEEDATDDYDDF